MLSKDNKYNNNGIPFSKNERPIDRKDIKINTDDIKIIVDQVLSNKLALLKKNKETMNLLFIFKPTGEIIDAAFSLHANTLITSEDIDEIDHELRAKIKASFSGTAYLDYEAISSKTLPTINF